MIFSFLFLYIHKKKYLIMVKFNDFVNEKKQNKKTYEAFISEIQKSMIKDFSMTKEQVLVFIRQYEDIINTSYENQLTPRETIASTKKYGTIEND